MVPLDGAMHADFVRANTVLTRVPLVPEVVMYTATAVTPLWHATEAWLGREGVDVPFWSVPWAGGQALARWVLDHAGDVRDKRVIDAGAGGGLVAIAAAKVGASVVAIDVDPVACAACELNAAANDVTIETRCADACAIDLDADVVLAGDVWYERAFASRIERALRAARARDHRRSGPRVCAGRSRGPRDLRSADAARSRVRGVAHDARRRAQSKCSGMLTTVCLPGGSKTSPFTMSWTHFEIGSGIPSCDVSFTPATFPSGASVISMRSVPPANGYCAR